MSVDHDRASTKSGSLRRSRVSTVSSVSSVSSPVGSNAPLPMRPPATIEPSPRIDPQRSGHSAEEYFYEMATTTPSSASSPMRNALERRKSSSYGRSSRSTRDHISARDLIRLLLSEQRDSKEALTILNKTAERLELETQRANDAERRLQEANDRWKLINQARLQAQSEASRTSEELRLYKLQLDTAQSQIARANDMITQTDREKTLAEDEAAKAKRLAKKYELETLIQKARDEGRRLGRVQGLREGREQGYDLALDEAYVQGRKDVRDRYVDNYGPDGDYGYDDEGEEYASEQRYDETEGDIPAMRPPPPPDPVMEPVPQRQMSVPQRQMPVPQEQTLIQQRRMPAQRQQEMPSYPQVRADAPEQMFAAAAGPSPSVRSNRFMGRLQRFGRGGSSIVGSNAEVTRVTPDVADTADNELVHTVTTPNMRMRRVQDPMHMPEPNFNPNPSDVPPISIYNNSSSPVHPHVDFPPDGYVPPMRDDGMIHLPPPHELQPAPPTPNQISSPLPPPPSLPRPNMPPTHSHREQDFMYTNDQPPRDGRHRYQKSVAESVASTNTSNLSILSPPGPSRSSIAQPRLSAIPESSPSGSMHQADFDGTMPPVRPLSRSSVNKYGGSDALGMNGVYQAGNSGSFDDPDRGYGPRDTDSIRAGDVASPYSSHSIRTGYSGPRKPSRLTTPAPLARGPVPAYARPRVHSGTTDSGFDARSMRGRERVAGSEHGRSRPIAMANSVPADPPEITIEPPSRSESLQSRKTNVPHDSTMSPGMPVYERPVSPPMPSSVPGMPKGFVPGTPLASIDEDMPEGFVPTTPRASQPPPGFVPVSPVIPEGAPLGFIPTTPMAPEGAPLGFVPTTPLVPEGAPLGFVPTSPAAPDGAPPGFIQISPAASESAPPGFVPVSPAVLEGAPPGFVPVSPAVPKGAPPGFIPVSTTIPTNPLPGEGYQAVSPNLSITGALPILIRPGNGEGPYYSVPTASPHSNRMSFGENEFGTQNRHGASEWSGRSAQGDDRSVSHTPRLVRGPEIYGGFEPPRPGTSMSGRQSFAGDTAPVIPNVSVYQNSRPTSPGMRRASRVSFGDPASVPIPSTAAPSLARTGRSSSYTSSRADSRTRTAGPAVARSSSARSEVSRAKVYPYGPPAVVPTSGRSSSYVPSGMPPAGLSSPYSRRLDSHPEDDDELVPSPHSSTYTLTTPPTGAHNLPGAVYSAAPTSRSASAYSSTGRARRAPLPMSTEDGRTPRHPSSPNRSSVFIPPDPAQTAAIYGRTAARPMNEFTDRNPALHRSASGVSMRSNRSYERFDKNDYVDPAVLASGGTTLLPLPGTGSSRRR
ncbi:hypothetical protein M0805_004797 [Coniferiporia weirii]|nr:hypothetical protein M0805_004797 [Coniferiporia weirii]